MSVDRTEREAGLLCTSVPFAAARFNPVNVRLLHGATSCLPCRLLPPGLTDLEPW